MRRARFIMSRKDKRWLRREEVAALELEQEEYRERVNPGWREQLEGHRKELGLGQETKGMGAREIINRALERMGYEGRGKGRWRRRV